MGLRAERIETEYRGAKVSDSSSRSGDASAGRGVSLQPKKRPALWFGLLLIVELVGLFIVAEWVAGWYLPPGHHYVHPQPIMEPDAHRIFSYRPNQRAFTIDKPFATNSLGIREGDIPPRAQGEVRIMVLGDSVTAGVGVIVEDTYVKQLEALLKQEHIVYRSINAGIAGYGTWQELDLLREMRGSIKPDIVILQFHWNDLYPKPAQVVPVSPAMSGDRQDAIQRYLRIFKRSRVLLFFRERWATFSNMLAPTFDWTHREMIFRGETNEYLEEAYRDMGRNFEEFASLEDDGIVPILMIMPMPMQVQQRDSSAPMQQRIESMARQTGLRTLDMLPELRQAYAEHPDVYIPWDNEHLTPAGHRVVAKALRQYLIDQHLIAIPKAG